MTTNEQSLKIGDRVRYVPRETDALEYGTVAEDVWQRRSQRDSLVVGVPDDDEYPTQYRLVAIFEPGEEASWSDRDFWYAPAERLQRSDLVYSVYAIRRKGMTLPSALIWVRLSDAEIHRQNQPDADRFEIVRRPRPEPWEVVA